MSWLLGALRVVVELALYATLAQGVLYLVAGAKRERNPIYRLFALLAEPPRKGLRIVLPSRVSSRWVALLTGGILLVLWLFLAWLRRKI